jgi:acetyl/propionyl-CoA carboxylase alpha subunit
VTGVDLVQAQIRVAGGLPLAWRQDDLLQRGHAIECRVYAEDPASGFLPQAGRILLYRAPERPGVRVDAGVESGSEVSVHYDPMIAKLIAHAGTRDAAIARAIAALSEFEVLGLATNISFLIGVLGSEAFRTGAIDTAFLDANGSDFVAPPRLPAAAVAAAVVHKERTASASAAGPGLDATDPWATLRNWRG